MNCKPSRFHLNIHRSKFSVQRSAFSVLTFPYRPLERGRRQKRRDDDHDDDRAEGRSAHDGPASGQRKCRTHADEDEADLPPRPPPPAHACLPSTAAAVSTSANPTASRRANSLRSTFMPISTKKTGTSSGPTGASNSASGGRAPGAEGARENPV